LPLSPQWELKKQNGRFTVKIAVLWKKVCYKIYLCKNPQRQSCKAFIGLSIRAKMVGGDVSWNVNFNVNHPLARQPCGSALSRNQTNTLFASQWIECNITFTTTPI